MTTADEQAMKGPRCPEKRAVSTYPYAERCRLLPEHDGPCHGLTGTWHPVPGTYLGVPVPKELKGNAGTPEWAWWSLGVRNTVATMKENAS